MRKRISWDKREFHLPYFYYHQIEPKPGLVYCLYGEQAPERFRVLFKFAQDLGYTTRTRFYNLLPEYRDFWWSNYCEEKDYFHYASHLKLIECEELLATSSPSDVADSLLQNIENNIVQDGVKVFLVDSVHFCKGKVLTRFLKAINKLARKYKVTFFLAADVRQHLDIDSIYFVKPAEYQHLYLNIDYFLGLMKMPWDSDCLLVKIWKGRCDVPKPAYKGKGWRQYDKNDNVFTLTYSHDLPWTVSYHGFSSLPSIFRNHLRLILQRAGRWNWY